MSLKTNYKDAVFSGKRLYRVTTVTGGSNIEDITSYQTQGDRFGAADINATNKAVNALYTDKTISLSASGWTLTAPYKQTVSVPGVTSTDAISIGKAATASTAASTAKLWDKMSALITSGTANNGSVTIVCAYKKPTSTFSIRLRGVSG